MAGVQDNSNATGNIYSTYSEVTTASTTVSAVNFTKYIKEKNATEQKPLVRLYSIFYPGEWYPPNKYGNPSGDGAGHSWPAGFPFRLAEIRADLITENQYVISMGNVDYTPYPINSGSINIDNAGKIGDLTISISNWDNIITTYIEDPYLVGNSRANSTSAIVNGELVHNIDPKTVPGNPSYDSNYANSRGGINIAYDYESVLAVNGEWVPGKLDTRDLLGAVVEIKSTYANFLDVWPEYSLSTDSVFITTIPVRSTLPYRVGDLICNNIRGVGNFYSVTEVNPSNLVVNSSFELSTSFPTGSRVCIVNPDKDPDAFTLDRFKIDSLTSSDDKLTTFSLTNWLQYFKLQLPKRKYYKNTCSWAYRGSECKYPGSGTGFIPGTNTILANGTVLADAAQANGYFTIRNESTLNASEDVCAKNLEACRLRNNEAHFGGFPGTGRSLPR